MQLEPTAESEIRARISKDGLISFAEFMELALYHPVDGYYTRSGPGIEITDYYTSPQIHPAFGALLAIQLHRMWEMIGKPPRFHTIEIGSGDGRLAGDVTSYLRHLPEDFMDAMRYITIDRGGTSSSTERILCNSVPLKDITGCILSNELLDAMPVHRFEVRNGSISELYVILKDGNFTEFLGNPSSTKLLSELSSQGINLHENQRGEINLRLRPWVDEVSVALKQGFVLTIDYGYGSPPISNHPHNNPTIQTYYRHTEDNNPYADIGLRDISAKVNFSYLANLGTNAKLNCLGISTQSEYLNRLGIKHWLHQLQCLGLTSKHESNLMAMRDLIRMDRLGNFKVLLQEKGTGTRTMADLMPHSIGTYKLPVPTLDTNHLDLMGSTYPHKTWGFGDSWMPPPSNPTN